MSTRCQIGLYEEENSPLANPHTLIYRHCDGYPDGVMPDLTVFVKSFIARRGWDIEYVGARLLPYLIARHTEDLPGEKEPFGGVLTYGICRPDAFHGDIEYYYAVYPDRIEIYQPRHDSDFNLLPTDNWKPEAWKNEEVEKITV